MDKIRKIISCIAILGGILYLTSCEQPKATMPVWLEGQWETGDSIGFAGESWEMITEQYMSGEGLFIMPDSTTVVELLNVFIRDGVLFYAALLPNQNSGEEILFIDKTNDPDSLVFENPRHDYPKKIVYHKKTKKSIEVYVYGSAQDKVKRFTLKKITE